MLNRPFTTCAILINAAAVVTYALLGMWPLALPHAALAAFCAAVLLWNRRRATIPPDLREAWEAPMPTLEDLIRDGRVTVTRKDGK